MSTKSDMRMKIGIRVYHRSGREATVIAHAGRHNGYRVSFDASERRPFEPEVVRVAAFDITPVDPVMHKEWEATWPSFTRKDRQWAHAAGDCPRCHGEGWITVGGYSINPSAGVPVPDPQCDHDERCPVCHGEGVKFSAGGQEP